jgi:glycosyltransferase involved in cell wall biosynthesis
MKKLPISVCLISGAEAHRIGRALDSVMDWTHEIIVVLNREVQDGTEEIALARGAKIFREPWQGFIAQKNSAAQKASQPWLLGLDADEEVPPGLRSEIESLFAHGPKENACAAYSLPRCTFYCGRWIRHGDWYPDRVVRLWKKEAASWAGLEPHARLSVRGPVGKLHSELLHFSNESIDRQIAKIAPYSDEFVRHRLAQGKSAGLFDLAVRPIWRFLRGYFFKLGFLDGWQGYYIASLTAFSTLTRYTKVREARLITER